MAISSTNNNKIIINPTVTQFNQLKRKHFTAELAQQTIFKNLPEPSYADSFLGYAERVKLLNLRSIEGEIFSSTLDKINLFAIHYLLKGAKYPLLFDMPYQLPYLSYWRNIKPGYYRANGGGPINFYQECLKQKGFGFLFGMNKADFPVATTVITKSSSFRRLFKGEFNVVNVVNKRDLRVENNFDKQFEAALQFLKTYKTAPLESYFFDITHLISKEYLPLNASVIKQRLLTIYNHFQQEGLLFKGEFGGMINLGDGQHLSILLKNNTPYHKKCMNAYTSYLTLGYNPDIVELERTLTKFHSLNLKQLIEFFPTVESSEALPVLDLFSAIEAIQELLEPLKELRNDTVRPYLFYFALINDCLEPMLSKITPLDTEDKDYNVKLTMDQNLISDALNKILSLLSKYRDFNPLAKEFSLEKLLTDVDLIFEEIILIMQLTLDEPAKASFIQTLQTLSQTCGFTPQVFTANSGMNIYSLFLQSLYKANNKNKLNALFFSNSYFELKLTLAAHNPRLINYTLCQRADQTFAHELFDVIFLDIFPNDATQANAGVFPLERLLPPKSLDARKKPLTLAIDTTTHLFCDETTQNIIKTYQSQIQSGKLQIALLSSLEKFAMCGLDKYTGGALMLYSKNSQTDCLNEILTNYTQKEPLSDEASTFFNLFFMKNGSWIKEYIQRINANTNRLYDALVPRLQGWSSSLQLANREKEIPIISFHIQNLIAKYLKNRHLTLKENNKFAEQLAIILRSYITILARNQSLPLSNRLSFGFSHSNLHEAVTALRLTVGLESEELLAKYATLFQTVSDELDQSNKPLYSPLKNIMDFPKYQNFMNKALGLPINQEFSFETFIQNLAAEVEIAKENLPSNIPLNKTLSPSTLRRARGGRNGLTSSGGRRLESREFTNSPTLRQKSITALTASSENTLNRTTEIRNTSFNPRKASMPRRGRGHSLTNTSSRMTVNPTSHLNFPEHPFANLPFTTVKLDNPLAVHVAESKSLTSNAPHVNSPITAGLGAVRPPMENRVIINPSKKQLPVTNDSKPTNKRDFSSSWRSSNASHKESSLNPNALSFIPSHLARHTNPLRETSVINRVGQQTLTPTNQIKSNTTLNEHVKKQSKENNS